MNNMGTLKNKKVLVTGGCGFIGSHIVDRLLNEGAVVAVMDNLASGKIENIAHHKNNITFLEKDIRDEKALTQALKGVELVCHQAALRSVPKSVLQPYEYHDVNVTATLKLFLKAKESGVTRIAYASSSSVYGEREDFPERETDFPLPISPYAASKLMDEHYAYLFAKLYNFEIVSLRYFNVYGPRQSMDDEYSVVIPKFIHCLLCNENPPIYGDGNQERDFTFIENVVDANVRALTTPGIGGEVFNVANGQPHSVNELLVMLKKIMNKPDVCAHHLAPRTGDVRKTWADVSKAKRILDWQPRLDFYSGLQKTVEWFKAQKGKK
ncbi:MAG: SDR family NAD(P)-dependent oxidoreductase [Candidatus Omnitrophica bacterium]|nr:SDR family NAD(P)-dependent oxidoreductase [Candidatus Omnitrophota bacterium]